MDWLQMTKQRDAQGNLTPLARALAALEYEGCYGTDEDNTCVMCLCEAALKDLWEAQQETMRQVAQLECQNALMADKLTRIVMVCGVFYPFAVLQEIKAIALETGLEASGK